MRERSDVMRIELAKGAKVMLIRSQCGMILTNNLDLEAHEDEWRKEQGYVTTAWIISNSTFSELGVYRSEEDAFKVLDYIENAYVRGDRIFKMPKKDEV